MLDDIIHTGDYICSVHTEKEEKRISHIVLPHIPEFI